MQLFSKRKYDDLDDVSLLTEDEKAEALKSLEARRIEINTELESLMRSYARLTKNRKIAKKKQAKPGFAMKSASGQNKSLRSEIRWTKRLSDQQTGVKRLLREYEMHRARRGT